MKFLEFGKYYLKMRNVFFTATAISNTSLIVIPEKFIEKELSKMDPFLRHCFQVWIPLREHFRDPIT